MKLNNLLAAGAVVTVLFGLALALMPETLAAQYGVALDAGGALMARLLGAAFLGFAVLNWLARESSDLAALRAIVLGNLVMDAAGFVVALLAQLAGVSNALGWSTVALYLLFGLGFAYFQFMKPQGG